MLKILIIGDRAEGKTTLLHEIDQHLTSLGFEVSLSDDGHILQTAAPVKDPY